MFKMLILHSDPGLNSLEGSGMDVTLKMADQEWCDFYVVFTVSLCAL